MSAFNGQMLRLARQFRGFQQRELAEKIGVDAAILSRAENDALVPSDAVISKCAEALSFPLSFFEVDYNPSGLPLSFHSQFRKKQSVSQREIDRVLADANIRALHLRALMPSIVFDPALPLPHFDPGEYRNDCREIAGLVRRTWALPSGPLLNLTDLMEQAGIFVFHSDLEKIDVDGLTLRLAGLPPIVVINKHMPADRMRFTLAHELGHIVMHSIPSLDMEAQANEFASALLMPKADLRPYFSGIKVDLALLARLKPEWRVSMAALLKTSSDLKFIGPGQAQLLWRTFSAKRYRLQEPSELDFPIEKTSLDRSLLDSHTNGLGYSLDDLASTMKIYAQDICKMYNLPLPRNGLRLVST